MGPLEVLPGRDIPVSPNRDPITHRPGSCHVAWLSHRLSQWGMSPKRLSHTLLSPISVHGCVAQAAHSALVHGSGCSRICYSPCPLVSILALLSPRPCRASPASPTHHPAPLPRGRSCPYPPSAGAPAAPGPLSPHIPRGAAQPRTPRPAPLPPSAPSSSRHWAPARRPRRGGGRDPRGRAGGRLMRRGGGCPVRCGAMRCGPAGPGPARPGGSSPLGAAGRRGGLGGGGGWSRRGAARGRWRSDHLGRAGRGGGWATRSGRRRAASGGAGCAQQQVQGTGRDGAGPDPLPALLPPPPGPAGRDGAGCSSRGGRGSASAAAPPGLTGPFGSLGGHGERSPPAEAWPRWQGQQGMGLLLGPTTVLWCV